MKLLKPEARTLFQADTYTKRMPDGLDKYYLDFPRPVDLTPLANVLREVMTRYKTEPEKSDPWLAPRLHAALRLYRDEAADSRLWEYLTMAAAREYTIWRWGNADGTITPNRVIGQERRNALGRLWWLAELARDGPDYTAVTQVSQLQESINTVTDVDFSQNRAAVQAYIRFMQPELNKPRGNKEAQSYRKGLNFLLATYALDVAAPDNPAYPDVEAVEVWIAEGPNETAFYEALPVGPDDTSVPEKSIAAIDRLLKELESRRPPSNNAVVSNGI